MSSGQNNACLKEELTLVLIMSKDLAAVTNLSSFEASIAFNWICEGSCVGSSKFTNSASKALEIKLEVWHSELLISADMLEAVKLDTKVVILDALEAVC